MNPLMAALQDPQAYPHPTGPITLMETHISWVLLTGPFAYKVKKPVSLGFLDFSSLEQRRHFCQEELRLNQRLAPELYLDVVEIHGPPEQASFKGAGPVVEVAVRMRQFEQGGLLPQALLAGTLTGEHLERFADRLAAFHGAAEMAPCEGPFGMPQAVVAPAVANLEVLRRLHPGWDAHARLGDWTHGEAHRLEGVFAERLARGRVREGHGDLHLGNLVLHQGEVVGFDCLEFNPALRWIDVLSDVAFLAMDLQAHGQGVWAARVLNRWLGACGDYGSLLTWRWYLTYRALVRAKVLALRLEQLADHSPHERRPLQRQLESYLEQAHRSSESSGSGALLLTHGVSGSGKSHLASQLCQRHGWIQLRSDVERRRLFGGWGIALDPPRQGEVYSPEVSAELYGELLPSAAEAALNAGLTVVVDATFLKRNQRQLFIDLAHRLQTPWLILDFPITLEEARRRLERRQAEGKDPSQADATVLMQQWQEREPLGDREEALQVEGRDLHAVEALLGAQRPELLRTTR
jgi:aminoglycoside phosphotransferase family enzyme/predicted kinase